MIAWLTRTGIMDQSLVVQIHFPIKYLVCYYRIKWKWKFKLRIAIISHWLYQVQHYLWNQTKNKQTKNPNIIVQKNKNNKNAKLFLLSCNSVSWIKKEIIPYVFFDMWRQFSGPLKSHPYSCYTQYIKEHLASCFICHPLRHAAP